MVSGVPRKTTLAIQGLITTPNEYGVYPEGAARDIRNWMARAANQWVCARDTEFVIQSGTASHMIYRVFGTAPGVFATITVDPTTGYVNGWQVNLNGDASTAFSLASPLSSTALFNPLGYLTPLIARSRIYLNSQQGVIVCDTVNPQSAGERSFRTAGITQPILGSISGITGDTIPNQVVVTYAVVVRRRSADGYIVISAPTPPTRYVSLIGNRTPTIDVSWDSSVKAGDDVEVYRSAGILDATGKADSGTSMRLVAVQTLSAADITAGTVTITDTQPMVSPLYETSGAEIYTSPYEEASTGANLTPPICKAMAAWGTYAFYGNITEDPTWTLDVPAGIISTYDPAADTAFVRKYGVGLRTVTGTRTAGSPVITSVSAAHLVGIVPGQQAFTGFPFGTTVVSVGASSITMSANTNSAGTGVTTEIRDVLEINGSVIGVDGISRISDAATRATPRLASYPSESIRSGTGFAYDFGVSIVFRPARSGIGTTITVRGTNGQNYSPAIPDIVATVKTIGQTEIPNLLRWSKQNQPEAVPTPNESFVGKGKIIRMFPTTDALIILCTDGAYRLTGEGGVWRTDIVDSSFVPCAPDAACVLNDVVYAYTGRGFCSLAGNQTTLISRGVIDAQFPGRQFEEIRRIHLYANQTTEEIITIFQNPVTLNSSSQVYVYSTLYKQWSMFDPAFDRYTAIGTFYPSVTGGLPYVLFGEYGSTGFAPVVSTWRPDSGVPIDQPELRLQPFYAGDPTVNKQWIDATWIAALNPDFNDVSMSQEINDGYSSGSAFFRRLNEIDARATLGIARKYAIGPSIELSAFVGTLGIDPPPVLKGVSIRYVPLTTQQRIR